METVLITGGVACLIAAIVGGGLKAFGIEIPALQSGRRQALLAVLGIIFLALGLSKGRIFNPSDPPANESTKSGNVVEAENAVAAGNFVEVENAAASENATEAGNVVEKENDSSSRNLNDAQRADLASLRPDGKPYRNATQEAQFLLKALGYDIRYPDGFEGPQTTLALEDFQRKHQLPVSGAADQATVETLRVRAAKKFLRQDGDQRD